jgi:transposase
MSVLIPDTTRIFLCTEHADMRRGPDGLAAMVRQQMGHNPLSGHIFVFLSRDRSRLKALWFDHGGYLVLYKRLSKGRFTRPGTPSLSRAELLALLENIDLSSLVRRKTWQPRIDKAA